MLDETQSRGGELTVPPRYTIRQVVGTYRRKAFGTRNDDGTPRRPAYQPDAIVAFYGMLELAEEQPRRGHFESERLLRVLLEGPDGRGRRFARQVPFLIAQGDLVRSADGSLDVEGWEILQEGDTTIADRVARFRSRKRHATANAPANDAANSDVTPPLTPPVTEDPRAGDDARVATRPQRRGDGYQATDSAAAVETSRRRTARATGWSAVGDLLPAAADGGKR